jgi:CheY-like chemotaxis protein
VVLVATADDDTRQRLGRRLNELGLSVATATDGPAALRTIVTADPALIIVDAKLPERSGVEIIRRLGSGERYREVPKVLLVPEALTAQRVGLDRVPELALVAAEQLDLHLETYVETIRRDGGSPAPRQSLGNGPAERARATLFRGLALREENDLEGATRLLREALQLDPLLPTAHRELARLCQTRDAVHEAMDRYSMALDLGEAAVEDITSLAELLQRQGLLCGAARVWERAATLVTDKEAATEIRAHAARLADRSAAGQAATSNR